MPINPMFTTSFDYQNAYNSILARKAELQDRLSHSLEKMGSQKKLMLDWERMPFPTIPPHATSNPTYGWVTLPILSFISPEELPPHLRVKSVDDPKLEDDGYFEQLSDWLTTTFSLPKRAVTWEDKQAFKLYVRFMQNPEMAKKGFDFTVHHELAHILHSHAEQGVSFLAKLVFFCFALLTGGAVLGSAGMSFSVATISLALALTVYKVCNFVAGCLQSRKKEWEADTTAVQTTKDLQGPTYLFEQMRSQMAASRNDPQAPWYAKLLITPSGDLIPFGITHQLESTRSAALQNEFAALPA